MYELKKKIVKVFTSKFVGTGPSSYKERIYRPAVSQSLRNTGLGCTSVLCTFIKQCTCKFGNLKTMLLYFLFVSVVSLMMVIQYIR